MDKGGRLGHTRHPSAITDNSLVFFRTPEAGIIAINLCVTSNGNKLEIVANQMNLNINLDLSRVY